MSGRDGVMADHMLVDAVETSNDKTQLGAHFLAKVPGFLSELGVLCPLGLYQIGQAGVQSFMFMLGHGVPPFESEIRLGGPGIIFAARSKPGGSGPRGYRLRS